MSESIKPHTFFYESTVKKVVQETKQENREENGKTVVVSTPVETTKDIKIAILKPNRRKLKEAEIFYAKKLSFYLKEGLLPYSLISKRYINDGGPLSENEKKAITTMRERYTELHTEYFAMKEPLSEKDKTRRGEMILEMGQINTTLQEYENAYASIFENTAEARAKSDTIEFWTLTLSYADLDDKGYKPLYGEGDLEAKIDVLEALENKKDEFTNELIRKLSFFISFWQTIGMQDDTEKFKSAETHYQTNLTTYLKPKELEDKLSEGLVPQIETPKIEPEPLSPMGSSIEKVA